VGIFPSGHPAPGSPPSKKRGFDRPSAGGGTIASKQKDRLAAVSPDLLALLSVQKSS